MKQKIADACEDPKCPARAWPTVLRGRRLHSALSRKGAPEAFCSPHREELLTWQRFGGPEP